MTLNDALNMHPGDLITWTDEKCFTMTLLVVIVKDATYDGADYVHLKGMGSWSSPFQTDLDDHYQRCSWRSYMFDDEQCKLMILHGRVKT